MTLILRGILAERLTVPNGRREYRQRQQLIASSESMILGVERNFAQKFRPKRSREQPQFFRPEDGLRPPSRVQFHK
jgi:hypothetical protein